MMVSLRILFVGEMWHGNTTMQRLTALENMGHEVCRISTTPPRMSAGQVLHLRVSGKLFRWGLDTCGPHERNGENAAILSAASVQKGITVEADTLESFRMLQPHCRIVGYSPDDMYARHNQSRPFLQSLPKYDIYFTTKSYGVGELKSLGARQVHFVDNAYDIATHRPIAITAHDRHNFGGRVGFIGIYEKERCRSMEFLAANGVEVRVWGQNWPAKRGVAGLRVEQACLWGDDYAMATCAYDINLGYLRKINRDRQTTRSVEIPACGAFMLAERTEEHQALFEEGKEAEYFDSNDELLEKVRYYLLNENDRKRIAAAGRERCIRSGYSNEARLSTMLDTAIQTL
jgi:spore maturation protein CgeB